MSSTVKAQLSAMKDKLDVLFANTTASERPDVIKDLRDYLSLQASGARRPGYDKHGNNAVG